MTAVLPYGQAAGTGPAQIHYPPAEVLAHVTRNAAGTTGATRFRVETPDSRLRVKVSILFVRSSPAGLVTNNAARIYIGEEEKDRSGYIGTTVVCNDVLRDAVGTIIHRASPLAIPENVALEGWSQEFVTAADSLIGFFSTGQGSGGTAGASGVWVLQTRFQPDGQRLDDKDWDYVIRNCKASLIDPEINLP